MADRSSHAQLHGDRWNSRIHVLCQAQGISQDVLSSFPCSSPEQALVKTAGKKFRIEAASLRIFAQAAQAMSIISLKHRTQSTGHLRLNTLSLLLLRTQNRRKWMYLSETTCLQSTLKLISRPRDLKILSARFLRCSLFFELSVGGSDRDRKDSSA